MVTYLEAGVLSAHVYHSEKSSSHGTTFYHITQKTKHTVDGKTGWAVISGVDPSITDTGPSPLELAAADAVNPLLRNFMGNANTNFFAALYVKFQLGKPTDAVVAFRGTANVGNDFEDIITWFPDVVGNKHDGKLPYKGKAVEFVRLARQYLDTHFFGLSQRLLFTGHSLGGALAQCISLDYFQCDAVVFNSPGCGNMPHMQGANAHLITNIDSRYDMVHRVGKTIGKVYLVDVPNDEALAKQLCDKQNHKQAETIDGETLVSPALGLSQALADTGKDCAALYAQHSIDNLVAAMPRYGALSQAEVEEPLAVAA